MWLVVAIPSHQSRVARVVEKESQFWSFDVTIAKQHVSPAFVLIGICFLARPPVLDAARVKQRCAAKTPVPPAKAGGGNPSAGHHA